MLIAGEGGHVQVQGCWLVTERQPLPPSPNLPASWQSPAFVRHAQADQGGNDFILSRAAPSPRSILPQLQRYLVCWGSPCDASSNVICIMAAIYSAGEGARCMCALAHLRILCCNCNATLLGSMLLLQERDLAAPCHMPCGSG